MATTWEFRVEAEDPEIARRAAVEAFREVDRLERLLSRFVEGSDVWCLNHLQRGGQRRIGDETHACLMRAMEMQEITSGAFDAGLGGVMDAVRKESPDWKQSLAALGEGCLALDDAQPIVACVEPGFQLDLGAIGKGFALDWARRVLAEWEITSALLSAGGSSILCIGEQPWPIRMLGDFLRTDISLREAAVGSSGKSVKGDHIVDTRRQTRQTLHHRAWAFCTNAADADALSTAAMVMDEAEIGETLRRYAQPAVIVLETIEQSCLVKRIYSEHPDFAAAIGVRE